MIEAQMQKASEEKTEKWDQDGDENKSKFYMNLVNDLW